MFSVYHIILSISQGDFSIHVNNESNTLILSVPCDMLDSNDILFQSQSYPNH